MKILELIFELEKIFGKNLNLPNLTFEEFVCDKADFISNMLQCRVTLNH
jgi:hypothetical protein